MNIVLIGYRGTGKSAIAQILAERLSMRVAGMDANNRQGIFSVASDPYLPDAGAPGQPGKPILF